MGEVDTVKIIKSLYANFYIQYPFLEFNGLNTSEKLITKLRKKKLTSKMDFSKKTMEDLIEELFENKDSPSSKRYSHFQKHSKLLVENKLSEKNFIPIIINGLSIQNGSFKQKGFDPFSNSNYFTTQLVNAFNGLLNQKEETTYPIEFLEKFRLIFLQPVTYVTKFSEVLREGNFVSGSAVIFDGNLNNNKNIIGLEEIFREDLETIGRYGTLIKTEGITPKIGNSEFKRELFFKKNILQELKHKGLSAEEYLKQESEIKKQIAINKHLMAIKIATLLDNNYENFIREIKKFNLGGIPVYAEKTSETAELIELAKRYATTPFESYYVGGGILSGVKETIPRGSISHRQALKKLFRVFNYTSKKWFNEKGENIIPQRLPLEEIKEIKEIEYLNSEIFQGILLEKESEEKNPNIEDVIKNCLDKKVFSKKVLQYVIDFANLNRVGFSRLEPRIVELFTQPQEVHKGLRNQNKENILWEEEIKNKKIITPRMLEGFFEMQEIKEQNAEFRGSEFSLPGAPKIDSKWLNNYWEKGIIDAGCSIQKIISKFRGNKFMRYIKNNLTEEELKEFEKTHNEDLEPIAALRGTAVHEISSRPLENLVHYKTLEKIGLPSSPSNDYSEMPIFCKLKIKDLEFTVSMHPDCVLFLEYENNILKGKEKQLDEKQLEEKQKDKKQYEDKKQYDILMLDTKTNRRTSTPEHKYIQQTYFYSWLIKKVVEKNLPVEIKNFYTVLNKNAFHEGFFGQEKKVLPHNTYRSQKFSPITKWDEDHYIHEMFSELLYTVIGEKRALSKDKELFLKYKQEKEKKGYCKKCYLVKRKMCELVKQDFGILETKPWEQ